MRKERTTFALVCTGVLLVFLYLWKTEGLHEQETIGSIATEKKCEDDPIPKIKHIDNRTYYPNLKWKQDYSSVFHHYDTRVDLRVIVLTYNRPESLSKCIKSLSSLVTDGYRVAMDIWIDVNTKLDVDMRTLEIASAFNWTQGPVTVWVHSKHVGLHGQWIYTWRPVMVNQTATSAELALYVEDDIDISPYAYRFLRNLHEFYSDYQNISSYTLQDISHLLQQKRIRKPRNDPIYMHTLVGTWGMAPRPERWAEFQDWFHKQSQVPGFRPYAKNAEYHTKIYKRFEKRGRANTLWSMWFIYFMEIKNLFSLFSNLPTFTGKSASSLSSNRREKGLHFNGKGGQHLIPQLLTHWDQTYVRFPKAPKLYDSKGNVVSYT